MAFKPNYNFQKAERDRAKQLKKENKQREKEEAARRKLEGDEKEPAATEPSDAA